MVLRLRIFVGAFLFFMVACNGPGVDPTVLGKDFMNQSPGVIPSGAVDPGLGSGCRNDDPKHICLAIKYVAYEDSANAATVTQQELLADLQAVNRVWARCNISFQIEKYVGIRPSDYQLNYQIANYSELTDIRGAFAEENSLLVVATGAWNRSGSLGNTGANAWTSLPGGAPYGAIIEKPVGTNGNLLAHELGHYLNLSHTSDAADLMNPIIYTTSTQLYESQCETTRAAAMYFWPKMIR